MLACELQRVIDYLGGIYADIVKAKCYSKDYYDGFYSAIENLDSIGTDDLRDSRRQLNEDSEEILQMYYDGKISNKEAAVSLGYSEKTFVQDTHVYKEFVRKHGYPRYRSMR